MAAVIGADARLDYDTRQVQRGGKAKEPHDTIIHGRRTDVHDER
jgi:hypothetical protein